MRIFALPPVRRAVPLTRGTSDARRSLELFFGGRKITLYASGTAALAHAVAACATRAEVSAPEIIVPAYGCPNLISACIHACVFPRLVDVQPNSWAYDVDAIRRSLSIRTIGIVAVNLLGVGDGSAELVNLCRERRITLIQDSAQYLPRQLIEWPGDYVVLSFGRGKPMNLLHGGALIVPRQETDPDAVPLSRHTLRGRLLATRAAAFAFNCLTHPSVFWMISQLPGTGFGRVVYRPLTNDAPLPERSWAQVGHAFELYRREPSYRRQIWAPAIEEWTHMGIRELESPGSSPPLEPLRLALLAPDRNARDAIVDRINRIHLGASRLYGTDLPRITGIPKTIRLQGPFPQAASLADRLFTLPTHNLVTDDAVSAARSTIREWQQSQLTYSRSTPNRASRA